MVNLEVVFGRFEHPYLKIRREIPPFLAGSWGFEPLLRKVLEI